MIYFQAGETIKQMYFPFLQAIIKQMFFVLYKRNGRTQEKTNKDFKIELKSLFYVLMRKIAV